MSNKYDRKVIDAWVRGEFKRYKSANVSQSTGGAVLYSYGHWFELGWLVPDPRTGEERGLAILNGDRFSPSTSRHQADTRWALGRANIPFVIIPFQACSAAGIVVNTIRPVHVEAERFEVIHHRDAYPPPSMVTYDAARHNHRLRLGEDWLQTDEQLSQVAGVIEQGGDLRWFTQAVVKRDGLYVWYTNRHWLGDLVFTASVDRGAKRRENVPFISSFDRQEARSLYFLSELPRHATDLDDALEALKPESVATAEVMGRSVTRQGDMFGIPMPGVGRRDLRSMGAVFTRRLVTIDWSPHAQALMIQRGRVEAVAAEVGPSPRQGERAYLAYRNEREAWLQKIADVYNERHQGQHLPAPQTQTMRPWLVTRALCYRPSDRWDRTRDVVGEPIYGTAHTATEVATLPDGTSLARGCLYHEPGIIRETRPADHARRKLGDGHTWHVVVRNTVPLQQERR